MIMKPCPRCKRMMPYGPAYCKDYAPIAQAELEEIRERNLKRRCKGTTAGEIPSTSRFIDQRAGRDRAVQSLSPYSTSARQG